MGRKLLKYCGNGHKFTPANTYYRKASRPNKDGSRTMSRQCRSCMNSYGRSYGRRIIAKRGGPKEAGSPIPKHEIHVTHTGIYFGRDNPGFKQAYIWFDIDPIELTFEPAKYYIRKYTYKVLPKYSITGNPCHIMQPIPLLKSGKIPFGVYETKDNELTYYLTDRQLPEWCRELNINNAKQELALA